MGAPQRLTINTLPAEVYNLMMVLILSAYACWIVRAVVRLYRTWQITTCVRQGRVVLVEGLGHRVEVSRGMACVVRYGEDAVKAKGTSEQHLTEEGCSISSFRFQLRGDATPLVLSSSFAPNATYVSTLLGLLAIQAFANVTKAHLNAIAHTCQMPIFHPVDRVALLPFPLRPSSLAFRWAQQADPREDDRRKRLRITFTLEGRKGKKEAGEIRTVQLFWCVARGRESEEGWSVAPWMQGR
eukprot:evm.model.NODE_22845_length_9914_cov_24.068287.1